MPLAVSTVLFTSPLLPTQLLRIGSPLDQSPTRRTAAATKESPMASSLFSLEGHTAVVTGCTRGIGQAVAVGLAEAGADLILVQRDTSNTATKEAVERLGRKASIYTADMGSREQVAALTPKILADGHQVRILVTCAGIQRRHKCEVFPDSDFDEVMQVNLNAVFTLCRDLGAHMLSLDPSPATGRRGSIINFASLLTFQGGLTVPAYAASKGAVGQLTKSFANEWTSRGVTVNAIAPGYIETEMNTALLNDPERLASISARIPAARWGSPDDFKGTAVYLASRASGYVSGHTLVVDGGWMGRRDGTSTREQAAEPIRWEFRKQQCKPWYSRPKIDQISTPMPSLPIRSQRSPSPFMHRSVTSITRAKRSFPSSAPSETPRPRPDDPPLGELAPVRAHDGRDLAALAADDAAARRRGDPREGAATGGTWPDRGRWRGNARLCEDEGPDVRRHSPPPPPPVSPPQDVGGTPPSLTEPPTHDHHHHMLLLLLRLYVCTYAHSRFSIDTTTTTTTTTRAHTHNHEIAPMGGTWELHGPRRQPTWPAGPWDSR
ncbi:2-deoxy-D-gluconate 3-dehydrogenase [Purpureocillium lilacinum]|uniref:2-deoxy-D-gluconate 3-dehydrogenase n=1 Tax=Purpureocillium lilacinum TaxID=33203 RepID=A0A2U3EQR7_PURLI|nr:2-deoxy-D-gluconate 3-dehydrogenase [Purpureocillium lilacinum]